MFSESECLVLNVSLWSSNRDAGELLCCGGTRDYDKKAMEGDPMIYIVIMLFVFSAGIASLMIIYMKKVKETAKRFYWSCLSCYSRNNGTKKMLIYTRFMWRLPGIVLRNSVSAKFLYLFLMNFINPFHKHSCRHSIEWKYFIFLFRRDRYSEYLNRGRSVNKLALQVEFSGNFLNKLKLT